MTFRMKTVLATFIAPAFVAGTAHAAEPGFYFGGSVGQTTAKASAGLDDGEGGFNTFHFDKQETGYKAFVGFNFLPWLGVEGGYVDFGNPSDNKNVVGFGNVQGEVDATGWEAFAVGTLPIGPVDLFVKAGGIEADFKLKVHGTALPTNLNDDENNQMFAYGAGAAMNFGKFGVRLEAEGYDVSKLDDLYFISLGATYHL